ncbi:TIGR04282 family arsenosugar biosynthesis glycosyltransferase [Candidatus Accumulibacter sp. ACC003]|uniref:TIGR04282 family arsenosugar biosynthesis glycosyltransferase n=1 Tax=Candidatus Accumulibacter sp. ACC003 TaxID=2823334 RepID=UPI0025BBF39D|nr:TIGR04282 family arsenosugar biosynthesis glycosyltransferase [Candidatus Accumulibacter sp. ACC003]
MAIFRARAEALAVAVFARAPRAGAAKTRLIPALGAAGAARLQRRLTLHALHVAQRAALGRVTLWAAPDASQRFFRALRRRCSVAGVGSFEIRSQFGDELGQRMASAFAAQGGPLLLIGSDCPALTAAHLAAAGSALLDAGDGGKDAVFIPADDGGYVLVGLRHPQPELFAGIAWGTEQVMAQTRQRLAQQRLRWAELPTLWDVDRPADLARLATLAAFSEYASAGCCEDLAQPADE